MNDIEECKFKSNNPQYTGKWKFANNHANSRWVVKKFGDIIRENLAIVNKSLKVIIGKQSGAKVPDQTLWHVKKTTLYGMKKEHTVFTLLKKYVIKIKKTNPDFMVSFKKVENNHCEVTTFKSIFISYWAQKGKGSKMDVRLSLL